MCRRKRCVRNFNKQQKLFIGKITKMGFYQCTDSLYRFKDYSVFIDRWENTHVITLSINNSIIYDSYLSISDFHSPKIDHKYNNILNYILDINVFKRRRKIEKILKNEVFQKQTS